MTTTDPTPASPDVLEIISETTADQFLTGNFAPVAQERTETDLRVTGELPAALNGSLLRDGPNPIGETGPNHHWFLGDGMVHGITLREGRAIEYRNRWVRTPEVGEALGEDVPARLDLGMGSGGVNVVGHAGKVLALGEVGFAFELGDDLSTKGQLGYDGRFAGNFTAHPKIDPVNGELVAFGYDFLGTNLRYFRLDAAGELIDIQPIETPQPTMMHDFGVTQSRVVFMDLPVVFDLEMVMEGKFPFHWSDDAGARLGVMPRDGGNDDVVWIDIDPCYVFHPMNAYDDGDRIVMDVARFNKMFATDHNGPDAYATLHRWTIDPVAGTVGVDQLDDRSIEFPRVHPGHETRPHRYGYTAQIRTNGGFTAEALLKYDVGTGAVEEHRMGPGRSASEGVFVPDPDRAGEEDGGWVLSVVYDEATDRSEVVVVDAQDFIAAPVATVHLPVRVPFGFHGNWVPAG